MYRYIDRQVSQLDDCERFLVYAMRDWVFAARARRCPVDAITLRFLSHRMVGAIAPFHHAMSLLSRHGRQTLHLACPCGVAVTEGEAVLLAMFAASRAPAFGGDMDCLIKSPYDRFFAEALSECSAAMAVAGMP